MLRYERICNFIIGNTSFFGRIMKDVSELVLYYPLLIEHILREAKWFDPETGEELTSGLMADIFSQGSRHSGSTVSFSMMSWKS